MPKVHPHYCSLTGGLDAAPVFFLATLVFENLYRIKINFYNIATVDFGTPLKSPLRLVVSSINISHTQAVSSFILLTLLPNFLLFAQTLLELVVDFIQLLNYFRNVSLKVVKSLTQGNHFL